MCGLKPTQAINTPATVNGAANIKNIKILSWGRSGKMNRTPEELEADELMREMGITSDWEIENIKDVAMNRFNVKKGKRPAIKRILDDAFQQLKEKSKRHGHI